MKNPFTPTFGIVPPVLAGRSAVLNNMRKAFRNWPGDPNLASILIGPRGCGKTALLSCIGDIAREEGWITVDTVAASGMMEDIYQCLLSSAADLTDREGDRHLTGVNIGQFLGLSWSVDEKETEPGWRTRMTAILNRLKELDIGLLITIDEVRGDIEEMVQFASIYQLLIREGYKLGLVMAGLPVHVSSLITSKEVTFLRRCRQNYLDNISDMEVRAAFRETIRTAGKEIDPDALNMAVAAAGGYAYMMQLVGYCIWDVSDDAREITGGDAAQGIKDASEDFKNGVLNSTYRELSKGDRAFACAMLQDADGSTLTDIAARIQKTKGYASTYKRRLMQAGVIRELPDGTFTYAIPGFREYLEEMKNN